MRLPLSASVAALLALPLVGFAGGCSDSPRPTSAHPPMSNADAGSVGFPDQPQAASLSVDEAGISAQVGAGGVDFIIPLRNLGGTSVAGQLNVTLISVDGLRTVETAAAPFQLGPTASGTATAHLASPPDVTAQAGWAGYSLRIESPNAPGLRVTRSLFAVVTPYDVQLEGPKALTHGHPARYRVRADNPVTHRPLPGVAVGVVVRKEGVVLAQQEGVTSDKGDVVFELAVDAEGDVQVEAHGAATGTVTLVTDATTIQVPGGKVLLTTDKPLYQPGQTIQLRALALDRDTQKPVANGKALFEVEDGKGNKVYKRSFTTDAYGIASTKFAIGNVVNMGTYKVRVTVGSDKAEKTVTVGRYALPKFKVDVAADKPWYQPGGVVSGSIDARYFFGKVVASADVTIEAVALDIGESVFARVVGKTDAAGHFVYSLTLPKALVGLPLDQGSAVVALRAKVVDTAGQTVQQEKTVSIVSRPLRIAIVPENTVLVPGLPNQVDVFVTDPTGAPTLDAAVVVTNGDAHVDARTDGYGHIGFEWTVAEAKNAGFLVNVTGKDGNTVEETFSLGAQAGAAHVLVRTDKAVYAVGESIAVEVRTSPGRAVAYVDWIHDGQPADLRTLDVKDGLARFAVTPDTALLGSNRIEAYVVDDGGNIVRAGRTVFVRGGGALSVDLSTDKPVYAPGAPAKLTLTVKDETGAPAVAALGVQIVDQAVFALVDARPGLLRSYFELEDAFAQPSYELRPPAVDVEKMLFQDTTASDPTTSAAAQVRAAATFAAIGGTGRAMGIAQSAWKDIPVAVKALLAPYFAAEKQRLLAPVNAAAADAIRRLAAEGCKATDYFCNSRQSAYKDALRKEIALHLVAYDFWGNAYQQGTSSDFLSFASSGPDELPGNDDDVTVSFSSTELSLPPDVLAIGGFRGGADAGGPVFLPEPFPPNAGGPSGAGGASDSKGGGGATGTASDEPRVRQQFPETLYVNPAIITDGNGQATIALDMADSITEWRVSSLAHTLTGKLGGGVGGVKVFQDFFVDVDFPATLTRGDEVSFPIAVYNYLDQPQTVHLSLDPATWYTALGPTTMDVPLAPGQVIGVRFPVRVTSVGRQTLTVRGLGGQKSDAVARTVLVEPDGKAIAAAQSGSLAAGSATLPVTFPADAIAGSQKLYLNVYPAFLAQVVQGMDSLLRVPNGCFEQTTSTAWPNVLVTDYLKATNQLKPDVQLKAESLMSAGYQRLLTFEHRGGGFSWFGEQDAAPFLSVTAFGLMEFADMAKVHPVDDAMIARTIAWLLSQQNGDGSWKGDMSEFFSFQTSLARNTAFTVWALASAGYTGPQLSKGLAFVAQQLASDSKADAYTLAIAANAFLTAAPNDPTATALVDRLVAAKQSQNDKVLWDTDGTQTNFYASGTDGSVATTALAVHALLLAGGHKDLADGGLKTLTSSVDSLGNYGSTQATIWTLRALLLATRKGTEGAVGSLAVDVDGAPFSQVALTADQADVMTTVDLAPSATTGTHQVALRFVGTGKVSYNLVAQHHVPWPAIPPAAAGPLFVTIGYDKTTLALDDTATATVTVKNATANAQNMILVTLGLPPGFAVETDDLDAYKKGGTLSHYEITGKQLLLYVSALKPSATLAIKYRLRATMPVRASDGGGEAYLYYQPEQRAVAQATTLEVQ